MLSHALRQPWSSLIFDVRQDGNIPSMPNTVIIDYPSALDTSAEDLAALQKHDQPLKRNLSRITGWPHHHYEWIKNPLMKSSPYFSLRCKANGLAVLCKSPKDLAALSPEDLLYMIECVFGLPARGSLG